MREARDEVSGALRIVGPKTGFPALLMPVLDEFCQAYPGIQPDIQLDDRLGDWVQDRVDVGFRIGTGLNEGVIGRTLFPVQMIVCAAPDILFWGILGALVLWTALREAARGRDRAQGAKRWNLALFGYRVLHC